MVGTCAVALGEDLTTLGLLKFVPEGQFHQSTRGMEFEVNHSKKPVCRLATLSRCLYTYAEGQGREMAPAGSFVPVEAMPPLSDVL